MSPATVNFDDGVDVPIPNASKPPSYLITSVRASLNLISPAPSAVIVILSPRKVTSVVDAPIVEAFIVLVSIVPPNV